MTNEIKTEAMNEERNEQEIPVEAVKKENVFVKVKNKVKDFEEKHPKIVKGVKLGGTILAAVGIGAMAYSVGKNSGATPELADKSDLFLPETSVPDLPEAGDTIGDVIDSVATEIPDVAEL